MTRVLSQHGNVIAADFRPRPWDGLKVEIEFKTETLFSDGSVMLTRTTALFAGKPIVIVHQLGDLITGRIVHLENKDVTK